MADTDLIVVGLGAAGTAAALTAANLGAEVLVLEKQARESHTPSARMSGAIVMTLNDVEKGTEYLHRCAMGAVPRDVSAAWAEKAVDLIPGWHDEVGLEIPMQLSGRAEHPDFPGAESVEVFRQALMVDGTPMPEPEALIPAAATHGAWGKRATLMRTGPHWYDGLMKAVDGNSRVTVRWSSPAERLIQDDDGRVIGARTADGSEFLATNGVVLCSGGFEFDDDMRASFLPARPAYFYGNPGNTGDGIRMAQDVGAGLWHMNQMFGRAMLRFPFEDGSWMNFHVFLTPAGYVLTDQHGDRFADEEAQALHRHDFFLNLTTYDPDRREFPRIPCYWFFDERRRLDGPLAPRTVGALAVGLYPWSEDNGVEIERGWIKRADSIEEVAALAGVKDPKAAAASVASYNQNCSSGSDPWRKNAETLVPLDSPPFYCVPMYPGGSNTSGGPKRDRHARVLTWYDEPIAGLYSAGELGQATGTLYPADGSNLSEALCFGRIAAESALNRKEH
jgi:succinate dehydrogenase/fumarate reductase flavoprotein subunit